MMNFPEQQHQADKKKQTKGRRRKSDNEEVMEGRGCL